MISPASLPVAHSLPAYGKLGASVEHMPWSPTYTTVWGFHHRLALNMRGLPYRTVWVDFADITPHCISIGAEPTQFTTFLGDNSKRPLYTFPVIHDPATGATVSDSFKIIRYLDMTYPLHRHPKIPAVLGDSKLSFVPEGTEVLQVVFDELWFEKVVMKLYPGFLLHFADQCTSARAREKFRRSREEVIGVKLEAICPNAEARAQHWKNTLEGLKLVAGWLDTRMSKVEGRRRFVMGEKFSWADLVIGNTFLMVRRLWGESAEWMELMEVDGGRWKDIIDVLTIWEYVDEEAKKTLKDWPVEN